MTMKKILFILTVFMALMLVPVEAAGYQASIEAENGTVGDVISVSVVLPQNTGITGGSFNLIYDNEAMELVEAKVGSLAAGNSPILNPNYAANKIRLVFAGISTVSNAGGTALTASFRLKTDGNAKLAVENFKLSDADGEPVSGCTGAEKSIVISKPPEQPQNSAVLALNQVKARIGETVSVQLELKNNAGLSALGLEINYDTAKLTLESVEQPNESPLSLSQTGKHEQKPYKLLFTTSDGKNTLYNGVIAKLTFRVKADAEIGKTDITVDYYKGPDGSYIDGVDVNVDENGNGVSLNYQNGSVDIRNHLTGDINDDETVDTKDVLAILWYILGEHTEEVNPNALDVNGDGRFGNMSDAVLLLQYVAGYEVVLQ